MTTLQQDLRALLATHGFEMVHSALHEMMRQDYEFLSKIFKTAPVAAALVPASVPTSVSAPSPAVPAPAPVPPPEPVAQTTNQTVKKVMKITVRKAVEEPLSSPVPPPMPPTPAPVLQPTEASTPSEGSLVNTLEMPAEKGKFRSPAEVKRFQKEAELKKRAELDAKGISVASLMTRDNLKKWIEDEGKTYAAVARDIIGCAETLVSTMAKNYGIQSKNSKRRAFITGRI